MPKLRAVGEASLEVHPMDDQVSACDPQALPLAAGIKLTARDPDALAHWLADGHRELDQWDRPDPVDLALRTTLRGDTELPLSSDAMEQLDG